MRSLLLFASFQFVYKIKAADTYTIENSAVGITVDGTKGCAVSAMWATGDPAKTNLINTYDLGRYIQASFYSGPQDYGDCVWSGQPWSWNPIAAGDSHGNPSPVLSVSTDVTSVSCSIIPMQWACDNNPCECTVDITYRLENNMVHANVTLHNQRADGTDYGFYPQEVPAVYTNGFLYRLMGYDGDAPCQDGAPLTEWNTGWNSTPGVWPWVPGHLQVTEPWLALIQENGFGVGIYTSAPEVQSSSGTFSMDAGFAGVKGSGGTSDSPTGYMAPIATTDLPGDGPWEYSFTLIAGDVSDIRNSACALWRSDWLNSTTNEVAGYDPISVPSRIRTTN